MMRALTLMVVALCGLLFTACYEHKQPVEPKPEPVAQTGDGPLLDRVEGEQGPVIFDHAGHMGYGFACTDCHHTTASGGMPSQGCVGCHPAPTGDDPAHGGPDDNMVLVGDTQDTATLPGVPFNHFTHGSSAGYKLACDSCHHMGGNIGCDSCHGPVAKRQGDQVVPKLKRAMHLQCMGCHEALVGNDPSSIAPVGCEACHVDRVLPRLDGGLSFDRAAHLACVSCHRDVQDERPAAPTNCEGCHVADFDPAQLEPEPSDGEPCETEECVPPEPGEGDEAVAEDDEAVAEDDEAAAPVEAAAPAEAPAASGGPGAVKWEGSMGVVTFQHGSHPMGCDTCHPGMAPMSSEKLGMEKGHAACSTCHAEVTGNCTKCHIQ
jgi:hypothetical protein